MCACERMSAKTNISSNAQKYVFKYVALFGVIILEKIKNIFLKNKIMFLSFSYCRKFAAFSECKENKTFIIKLGFTFGNKCTHHCQQ